MQQNIHALAARLRAYAERDLTASATRIAADAQRAAALIGASDKVEALELTAALAQLGWKRLAPVPVWTLPYLRDSIAAARRTNASGHRDDEGAAFEASRLIFPLLTLALITGDPAPEREARRLSRASLCRHAVRQAPAAPTLADPMSRSSLYADTQCGNQNNP